MNKLEAKLRALVISFVREVYGIDPERIDPISEGIAGANFRVLGPELDLVVRCDLRRSLAEVRADYAYQEAARQAGVNVPPGPIRIAALDGVIITGRLMIDGQPLSRWKPIPSNLAGFAGRQLAAIHGVTTELRRNNFYKFVYDLDDERWSTIAQYAFHSPEPELSSLAKKLGHLIKVLGSQFDPSQGGSISMVHNDFTPSNLLVTAQENIVVLDWEKASWGSTLYDLGRSLFFALCHAGREIDLCVAQALLEEYHPNTFLTQDECGRLPEAISVAGAAFFLLDVAFAGLNRAKPINEADPRREEYFRSFCVPTYHRYLQEEPLIRDAIATVIARVCMQTC